MQQQVSDMLPQLVQLKEGLSSCKLLYSVQKYPKIWEPVFVASEGAEVTGSSVLDEIEPIYSESQLNRHKETDVYYQFSEFVHDLASNGKRLFNCYFVRNLTTPAVSTYVFMWRQFRHKFVFSF